MLSIQDLRDDRPAITILSLCCALYRDSNNDTFSCSVFFV